MLPFIVQVARLVRLAHYNDANLQSGQVDEATVDALSSESGQHDTDTRPLLSIADAVARDAAMRVR